MSRSTVALFGTFLSVAPLLHESRAAAGTLSPPVVTMFSAGISPGSRALGLVKGPDGNLWFAEFGTSRIGRITRAGVVTEFELSRKRYPMYMAVGPDGNIWFTEFAGNGIGRITPDGVVTEFGVPDLTNEVQGITVDANLNVWFSNYCRDAIGRRSPDGVVTEFPLSPGAGPNGAAVGPDGNLWFAEYGLPGIARVTPEGVVTEFTAGLTSGGRPSNITAGPDGNLWFTLLGSGMIGRITPEGVITEFSLGGGEAGWITAGPDGNLWCSGWSWVGRITTGGAVTFFPVEGLPAGLAFDDDGHLWYADERGGGWNSRIGRVILKETPSADLAVTKDGDGAGTVTSEPAGIDCGPACSAEFPIVTTVTLTATPSDGSTYFAGWTGEGCSGAGTCAVTIDQARSVTASFRATATRPAVSISAESGVICSAGSVPLTAIPSGGTGTYPAYQWYLDGVAVPGATLGTHDATLAGRYTVTVTDSAYGVSEPSTAIVLVSVAELADLHPTAWWRAEGNAYDSVGTAHATLVNGATFAPGWVGQALSLDGVDDYVDLGPAQLVPDGWFSVSMWIYPTGPELTGHWNGMVSLGVVDEPGQRLGAECASSNSQVSLGLIRNGALLFALWARRDDRYVLFEVPPTNAWTHVVLTVHASTVAWGHVAQPQGYVWIHVNGSKQYWCVWETAVNTPLNTAEDSMGSGFEGLIDEVQLFDRALTDEEVLHLYRSQSLFAAGPPQVIPCGGTTSDLGGSTPLTGTAGLWSVVSGGTGTFSPSASAPDATFTHTGGTGPLVLRWTISTPRCLVGSSDVTVTIEAPPLSASIAPSGATTFCTGGAVTLTASAASSYLWSTGATTPSITVASTGTYTVTAYDSWGFSATSAPVTVTVLPLPEASITASGGTGSVTLTASPGASYEWTTGATSREISVTETGSYSVRVTSDLGCFAWSAPAQVTVLAEGQTSTTTGAVTTTFDAVTTGGPVTVAAIEPPPAGELPAGYFELPGAGTAYEIATGASYTGSVTLSFQLTGPMSEADFNAVRVLHGEAGLLVDRTTGRDYSTLTVSATVASLSPFVLARVRVPSVTGVTTPLVPTPVGTAITVSATFTDPDPTDTHTALWTWGDGTTSAGVVTESNGSGSVAGQHVYLAAGVFTVRLTVGDGAGTGNGTSPFVVVYDPSGGFVTGGGWISSPAGAYTASPALTGKASFGFVSKYEPGHSVPTGNTQFQFQAARFTFKSTSYEWLVVSGPKAQYKGVGTVNGSGSYSFILTAIDGDVGGGHGVDQLRLKVYDQNQGNGVVYDNQLGAPDSADPTTALGGGSIVIHK